jgi:hypothetical protein
MLLYSYIVAKREASEYSFSFFFHSFMHNPGLIYFYHLVLMFPVGNELRIIKMRVRVCVRAFYHVGV